MTDRYQHARADGTPNWTNGALTFARMWDRVRDQLRFHRGGGFEVTVRGFSGPTVHKLNEIESVLTWPLQHRPLDTVIEVESRADGFSVVMRRHDVALTARQIVEARATELIGTPYLLGATDCSWYTLTCAAEVGVELIHNAHQQHLQAITIPITRAQIQPFDLLFHHDDEHVSWYLDDLFGGRVMDTEPHDTTGPPGWPTSHLGVGVQVRPMTPGWYCDWAHVNGIGRLEAINGAG